MRLQIFSDCNDQTNNPRLYLQIFSLRTSNQCSVICLNSNRYFCLRILLPQWEEEAAGEHCESHPVQHEWQKVHGHRWAQDQPVAAGLHQEPVWVHPGCSWQLKWAETEKAADFEAVLNNNDDDSLVVLFCRAANNVTEQLGPQFGKQCQIWIFSWILAGGCFFYMHYMIMHQRGVRSFFRIKNWNDLLCAIFFLSCIDYFEWRWEEIMQQLFSEPLMLHKRQKK